MSNKRDTLLALAERLEAATGPDRELDCLIAEAGGWASVWRNYDEAGGWSPRGVCESSIPRFTRSLDAAMSLVRGDGQSVMREALLRLGGHFLLATNHWPADQNYSQWLARFVIAAALRAHAAMEKPDA